MLTVKIPSLHFPNNNSIDNPITVALYIKDYYGGTYSLIQDNVPVNTSGVITASPVPSVSIDPTQKYVLKAINELCGFEYEQDLALYPYCPPNYTLSEDASSCYIEDIVAATPPTDGENTVAATNDVYSSCGTVILDPGYSVDGTGTYTQINLSNPYWRNGTVLCGNNNLVDGPLNRCGLWAATLTGGEQTVGFSVCLNITEGKTFFVGFGCDNYGSIRLDGNDVVVQNESAVDSYFGFGGSCFKFWFIYPVYVPAGFHVLEIIGTNAGSAAGFGCQVYDNTQYEIESATSDAGLTFLFNSSDYIGMPVVLGSEGIGYSCPSGYALSTCDSPIQCRKLIQVPVIY